MKTTFVFIPTWRCNLKCSYCDYETGRRKHAGGYGLVAFGKKMMIGPEIEWPVWLYLLNRFRPYHLDLTGGEPLRYDGLADFMAHLPVWSTWGITSNTLVGDLKGFKPLNCKGWTASYHYHSSDRFFRNLSILRDQGFNVRVTIVLTPENEKRARTAIGRMNEQGFGVNIHPILKQGFDWGKHSRIWDEFKAMDDGKWIMFISDIPQKFIEIDWPKPQACRAGTDYFVLFPDGMVYRCYTMILRGKPLGHIKEVIPFKEAQPCKIRCQFPCDLEVPKEPM